MQRSAFSRPLCERSSGDASPRRRGTATGQWRESDVGLRSRVRNAAMAEVAVMLRGAGEGGREQRATAIAAARRDAAG